MKAMAIFPLAAALLSGCVSGGGDSIVTRTSQTQGNEITKAQIETCWKQAGIKGDLYKFLTPSEAVGLRPAGAVSKSQHAAFHSCLNA
ncbi:50S ribosomal protein L20 [Pseudophaeobacter sp.]|uniref:50S ribosomal protein L20 n=1 Tax=Pseudophaeobacter sp. TaxID=1971739 RepID=UPI0040582F80